VYLAHSGVIVGRKAGQRGKSGSDSRLSCSGRWPGTIFPGPAPEQGVSLSRWRELRPWSPPWLRRRWAALGSDACACRLQGTCAAQALDGFGYLVRFQALPNSDLSGVYAVEVETVCRVAPAIRGDNATSPSGKAPGFGSGIAGSIPAVAIAFAVGGLKGRTT
jgi:hypothetical protein